MMEDSKYVKTFSVVQRLDWPIGLHISFFIREESLSNYASYMEIDSCEDHFASQSSTLSSLKISNIQLCARRCQTCPWSNSAKCCQRSLGAYPFQPEVRQQMKIRFLIIV